MEIFAGAQMFSTHLVTLLSPSQCSSILSSKLVREAPSLGMCEHTENSSLQTRLPSPVTLAWIDSPWTLSQVWASRKVCWVLVLASFCWPPSWHFDQAGGWYHLLAAWPEMPLPGQNLTFWKEPALDHEARAKPYSGEAHWSFLPSENHKPKEPDADYWMKAPIRQQHLCQSWLDLLTQALGTAISLLSRWSHLTSTIALKGEHGFKKVPLYFIWFDTVHWRE